MGRQLIADGSTIYLQDIFTGTNGTAIDAHTPDIGSGSWLQTNSLSFYIQSNKLQSNRNTDGDLAIIDSGLSDINISTTVSPFNSSFNSGYPGIVFRYVDANNFWYAFADSFNTRIQVYSVEGGVHNERIRYVNSAIISSASIKLEVRCCGNNVTLFYNDVEIVTYVSLFNRNATKVGMRYGKSGTAQTVTWDNLVVTPFSGLNFNWPLFTKHTSNPIISLGGVGAWDHADINDPSLVYDPANNRHTIVYTGHNGDGNRYQDIGLSYSSNLLGTWTKLAGNPVLANSQPADGIYGMNGGIVKLGTTYYYYYGTNNASQIGVATSTDLINWTRQGVVLSPSLSWEGSGVFDAFARVRQDSQTIELWYCANSANNHCWYLLNKSGWSSGDTP